MTSKQAMIRLFDYCEWANHRFLDAVAPLDAETFRRDLKGSHGGIRGTLFHTYGAELLWHDRDSVDAVLSFTYEDRHQDPSVYWDPEVGLDEDEVDIDLADDGYDRSEIYSLTANVTWDLGNDYSLTSITGYKNYNFNYLEDYDARPERINLYGQRNGIDYYSQELRLNFGGERLDWFVGASAYEEEIDGFFQFGYDENALCNAVGRTDAPDFSGPVTGGCTDPVFEEYWGSPIDAAALLDRRELLERHGEQGYLGLRRRDLVDHRVARSHRRRALDL